MSKFAHPPKLRSYVDHWPHSTADYPHENPAWPHKASYLPHWPEAGDGPVQTSRKHFYSYLDHFAKPGDLNQM